MHYLIAPPNGIAPGRKPHGNAVMDGMGDSEEVAYQEAGKERGHPEQSQRGTVSRDAVHGQEYCRKYERRPQVLLDIEKQQRDSHPGQHGRCVFQPRQFQPGQNKSFFGQLPQQGPTTSEVSGQEKHQQNLNCLNRLHRAEIDPGVAGTRGCPECEQGDGQQRSPHQRNETESGRRRLPIHKARGQHHDATHRHTLRIGDENHHVPYRVSQGEHQRETNSGEQQ